MTEKVRPVREPKPAPKEVIETRTIPDTRSINEPPAEANLPLVTRILMNMARLQ